VPAPRLVPAPDLLRAGLNYRMTDVQAAMGVTQMAKLDRIIEGRRAAAERYDALLAGTPVARPNTAAGAVPVWQSYVTMLPAAALTVIAIVSGRDGEEAMV